MFSSAGLALSAVMSLCSIAQGYVIRVDSHDGAIKSYDVPGSNLTAEEFLANPEPVHFRRDIKEREAPCVANTQVDYYYVLVGNGNPHQNYKIGQVENTIVSCSPGATVQTGEEHTFSWSIGGGFEAGADPYAFANVGFSVGESDSKSVQESFQCGANGMSEICAMHYTAVTAVTVNFRSKTRNCNLESDNDLGTGVVYLPNANGVGSTIARGTNFGDRNIIQCRGEAAREIDFFCGPPGGPEWFDTHGYGPWTDAYMAAREPAGCDAPIEAFQFLD